MITQTVPDVTPADYAALFKIKPLTDFQNESEKLFITEKLIRNNYNVAKTAKMLQIQRSHMYNLINKYEISTLRKHIVHYTDGKYTVIFEPKGAIFNYFIKDNLSYTRRAKKVLKWIICTKRNIPYNARKIIKRLYEFEKEDQRRLKLPK